MDFGERAQERESGKSMCAKGPTRLEISEQRADGRLFGRPLIIRKYSSAMRARWV
jgi:hypothetical protein